MVVPHLARLLQTVQFPLLVVYPLQVTFAAGLSGGDGKPGDLKHATRTALHRTLTTNWLSTTTIGTLITLLAAKTLATTDGVLQTILSSALAHCSCLGLASPMHASTLLPSAHPKHRDRAAQHGAFRVATFDPLQVISTCDCALEDLHTASSLGFVDARQD